MATMRTSGVILGNIAEQLADNNAGLISAGDVRDNMEDIVFSINSIVASGDTVVQFPFFNDVKAKHDASEGTGGTFIAESGITFPNSTVSTARQTEPFLGVGGLLHDDLGGLTAGDTHTQYVSISGHKSGRPMTGNLAMASNWIGSAGNSNTGFKFSPNDDSTEDILTSGDLVFGDNSRINTGFSVAKAWLRFDANDVDAGNVPVVHSWYNISGIKRDDVGKFTITFDSGVFANNNYVAIGTSNGTITSGSKEDMTVNTVACVLRNGDDASALRTCTFVTETGPGTYVNGKINDFVAYGYEPTAISGTVPTVTVSP